MNRRSVLHVLFALLLLVAQQLAIAHAIGHVYSDTSARTSDQGEPVAEFCDQCLALAQLGAAAGTVHRFECADGEFGPLPPATQVSFHSPFLAAFSARAPPASI